MRPGIKNINKFLLFKLPSAYFSGIRVTEMNEQQAIARVKHQWINQNPFRSLYWATQGMASELVTGVLLMVHISNSNKNISMLVTAQTGEFFKKATGRISFICEEGDKINAVIQKAIESGEGQTLLLSASGFNEQNEKVSHFTYTWSIKLKS
ncbi:MAG: DUF4442 domain-containing protein [Flavobacteriaceae bacterium]|nr:DUF4442 domain-containing protein [Flavobacteriaceae bacterium]